MNMSISPNSAQSIAQSFALRAGRRDGYCFGRFFQLLQPVSELVARRLKLAAQRSFHLAQLVSERVQRFFPFVARSRLLVVLFHLFFLSLRPGRPSLGPLHAANAS